MTTKPMSAIDAAFVIIDEARAERRRNTAFSKCTKALDRLGLDREEAIKVLYYLELCDHMGVPWPRLK